MEHVGAGWVMVGVEEWREPIELSFSLETHWPYLCYLACAWERGNSFFSPDARLLVNAKVAVHSVNASNHTTQCWHTRKSMDWSTFLAQLISLGKRRHRRCVLGDSVSLSDASIRTWQARGWISKCTAAIQRNCSSFITDWGVLLSAFCGMAGRRWIRAKLLLFAKHFV